MKVRENIRRLLLLTLCLVLFMSCLIPVSAAIVPKALNKASPINTYQQMIFVGDSRTVMLGQDLNRLGYNKDKSMQFIAKRGIGYYWLASTGYPNLIAALRAKPTRRSAVIFNFGINDLKNLDLYLKFLSRAADTLSRYNCDLYYMSVNPTDNEKCVQHSRPPRDEAMLAAFNRALAASLDKRYTYLDTIRYLNLKRAQGKLTKDTFTVDGLHFTELTNRYIFNRTKYVLQKSITKLTPKNMKKTGSGKMTRFSDGNGQVLKSRWLTYANYTFYANASGCAQTGYAGGYFFDAYGRLYRNQWVKYGKSYYYVGADGKKKTNCWVKAFRVDSLGRYVGTR